MFLQNILCNFRGKYKCESTKYKKREIDEHIAAVSSNTRNIVRKLELQLCSLLRNITILISKWIIIVYKIM